MPVRTRFSLWKTGLTGFALNKPKLAEGERRRLSPSRVPGPQRPRIRSAASHRLLRFQRPRARFRPFRQNQPAPAFAAVVGDIERQFQAAPYPQLVENDAQVVFHHLLRGADGLPDFAVGHALPYQGGDFDFPWG